jgi:hypothetical protein
LGKRLTILLFAPIIFLTGWILQLNDASTAHQQAIQITNFDLAGKNNAPNVALLKRFVVQHMGSSITIFLPGSYQRQESAAYAALHQTIAAEAQDTQYETAAQQACATEPSSTDQINCNQMYLEAHMPSILFPRSAAFPLRSNDTLTFVAPVWTPDLAGILMLISVIWLLLAIFHSAKTKHVQSSLKPHDSPNPV